MFPDIAIIIENLSVNMSGYAPIVACLLILIESMVPILPLCTFITINFLCFGSFYGFIISWIFTCLGCILSYYLVLKGIRNWYKTRMKTVKLLDKCLEYVNKLSFPIFTTLLAMPFTPAFMINIAAGLSHMKFSKFILSVAIGKFFMVYFWGYIGVGIIQSIANPIILIKIVILLILAYFLSFVLNHIIEKNS